MKKIKYLFICFVFSVASVAQNTAIDFTEEDCNGVTHSLFDSLSAGNVIVIAWVMPCGACATYGKYAYDAVNSFAISHPGRVKFYLVDDYANTSCSNLVNWGNANQMPFSTVFSSSAISMSDYGSNGMPKVVVLGCDAGVYYNQNDNQIDYNSVRSSIDNALCSSTGFSEQITNTFSLSIFPNPTKGKLSIIYELDNSDQRRLEIVNVLGDILLRYDDNSYYPSGLNKENIDISGLNTGFYFLNFYSGSNFKSLKFFLVND